MSVPQLPRISTWQEALRYCEDLVFAERSDWRLPNVRELESIADFPRRYPRAALDPIFDGEVEHYWTSTSVSRQTVKAPRKGRCSPAWC
jgi:hypothetical protein